MPAYGPAARRKRRITPIRDFADRNTTMAARSVLRFTTRLHQNVRRSDMFSLLFRFMKLCAYLFFTLLALLLTLNFKLVYQGNGNFTIRAKDRWAFEGTFVRASRRSPGVAGPGMPNGPSGMTQAGQPAVTGRRLPGAGLGRTGAAAPVPRSGGGRSDMRSSLAECADIRAELIKAVERFDRAHQGKPMRDLDVFTLLSEGYLKELPNCPVGGEYSLHRDRQGRPRISCSRHIE